MSREGRETEGPSAADMQAALEHALVGVCVLDADTLRARWCNATFRRFIAEPARGAEIDGLFAAEIVPHFEEHNYERVFRLVTESGRPFVNLEDEHGDGNGERTYWRWSVTALPAGGGLMIQAVDVTDNVAMRRQAAASRAAEVSARQQSARIEAILDSTDEGIVVGDVHGNVLYMNPAPT